MQFPSSSINKYTYNDRNLLSTLRVSHDSQNDDTTYTYDDAGRLTQTDFPDGGMQSTTYDQLGRGQAQSVQLDVSIALNTSYEYNKNNQRTLVTLPGSYTNDSAYDDLGNLTTYTDSNGDDTTYTYDKDNRRLSETKPNGLVTTWSYDWKTGNVSSVLYERNTTSGDDITVSYAYDDNGSLTTLTDGRGYSWTKAYDAMGRMVSLTTPNPGGGAYTHSIWYNGNGSMTKTTDFKGVSHYYAYDALGRMTGHGASSSANDETYTWGCCSRLTAYSDALGTASLSYDNLNRVTSNTDSNGNNVAYEYDALGRVTKLTPAQGSNYRTEYQYTLAGSLSKVKVYDAGTAADTDYTYDAASGQLTRRDFPVNGFAQRIRTAYAYDSAGRLEYETQTREAGGSTNLYKTQYAYSYIAAGSGGGRQLVRTEQSYSGGAWNNDNKLTYKYDALERLTFEERHDWASGAWSTRYDTTQAYDKNGNRTGYDHNVAGGYTTSYGRACNLSYTFDAVNALTAVTDADDARYGAALTCDANGNITTVLEYNYSAGTPPVPESTLQTDFSYDDLNRLTRHQTTRYVGGGTANTQYVRRDHVIDATGRLVKSSYMTWYEGDTPPSPSSLEHVYDGARHVQNYDGVSTYGSVWHWAGAPLGYSAPLRSPNPDTANQKGYNIGAISGKFAGQRRTWIDATTEGDKREQYGQGRQQAKNSSGAGVNWYLGTTSDPPVSGTAVESRFFFEGTVTATDMSRATDAKESGAIGIFGTSNSYGGAYGRVANEALGCALNPFGGGNGAYASGGSIVVTGMTPRLPGVSGILMAGSASVNASICPSMDSWMTQGLLPGMSGGGSCGSCGITAGTGSSSPCPGASPSHTCGIKDGHASQDFCSVCLGWVGSGQMCAPWQYTTPYWGKCVRCCCDPPCQAGVNCVDYGVHTFWNCLYMEATMAREQELLRQGMSVDAMLVRLCHRNPQSECGENSDLCPPGYEGGGQDTWPQREGECKCKCKSRVNDIANTLKNAYRKGGRMISAIESCKLWLKAADQVGYSVTECLDKGLRQIGSGYTEIVGCGNPAKPPGVCSACGFLGELARHEDRFVDGIKVGNVIGVCCLKIDRRNGGENGFPLFLNNQTCYCSTLSSILHEVIHTGGCSAHTNAIGLDWNNWDLFMDCVCSRMPGAHGGETLPPVSGAL